MNKNLLTVFIKNPVAGNVKTRLAASIGDLNALHVYKSLLAYTREVSLNVNCDRQVWYSSKIDRRDSWSPKEFTKKLQRGDDLGERMAMAFREGFKDGYEKIVIIGSDCAALTSNHIEKAFNSLDQYDAVLGPSEDGGYYLLGLTIFSEEFFKNIEWSTPAVFDSTKRIFKKHEISCQILEELNDIDTIDDLRQSSLKIEAMK